MFAAELNANHEVIMTLLKAGADAKAKNNKGYTAFDYAKYNESLRGIDALKQLEEAL
jgi:ankyrin repeat protein